jgi:hypothetical protein
MTRLAVSPGSRGRWVVVGIACLALVALDGCERTADRTSDGRIAAAVEKAHREDEEADRRLRERAIEAELERRQAEQAEIDARTRSEEARQATIARLEERLRGVLIDPASLQIRNPRLAGDRTLCTEFNARNKQGVYLGFRRAVVSDTALSLEQDPDDAYREPHQRFAEVARITGCY